MFWVVLVLAVFAGLVYVRVAPTDLVRWHKPIGNAETADGEGWSARVIPATPGLLSSLHQSMLVMPRTKMIAGSISDGRLTYISRSKLIGFPDYTTIERDDAQIKLYGRLRFGRSDLGVNGKRLDSVIAKARAKGTKG
jgi:hypothetical protein